MFSKQFQVHPFDDTDAMQNRIRELEERLNRLEGKPAKKGSKGKNKPLKPSKNGNRS